MAKFKSPREKLARRRQRQYRIVSRVMDEFLEENPTMRVHDTNLLTFHTWAYKRINS